jgi:hypothetical protein
MIRMRLVGLFGLLLIAGGCNCGSEPASGSNDTGAGDVSAILGDVGHADVGHAAVDASLPSDGSLPEGDAAEPTVDGSLPEGDAGQPTADGSLPPAPDASQPLPDASQPPGPDAAYLSDVGASPGPDASSPADTGSICGAQCVLGATQCGAGGGVQTCALNPVSGCNEFGAEIACGTRQSCIVSGGVASCQCKVDPTCTSANPVCTGPTTLVNCAVDTDGCFYQQSINLCPSPQVCLVSSCQCPTVGTTAGSGCSGPTTTACDSATGNILSCDAVGACDVWVQSTDCVAKGLRCGAQSGNATCECALNTGTDLYADSINGSDATAAGVRPTGILDPAVCRFGSLTFALGKVVSGGRVIATGASVAGSVTFTKSASGNTEKFPLTVPANVTLTTTDTKPTPANYFIRFNDGVATNVVILSDGSVIDGFTINNPSAGPLPPGNVNAPFILCKSGSVAVSGMALNAGIPPNQSHDGIDVTGSCVASIGTVDAAGFSTQAMLFSATPSAIANSSVTGGTLTGNALGMLITASTVTVTGTTVDSSTTNGIQVAPSGAAGATLFGNNLTITKSGASGLLIQPNAVATLTGGSLSDNSPAAVLDGATQNGGSLTATNVTFSNNGGSGLTVNLGKTAISGSTFTGNGSSSGVPLPAYVAGLTVNGGVVTVGGGTSVTSNVGSGIYVTPISGSTSGLTLDVTGAKVTLNRRAGIRVASNVGIATVLLHGVSASNNTEQGLDVGQGTVSVDGVSHFDDNGVAAGGQPKAGIRAIGGTLVIDTDPTSGVPIPNTSTTAYTNGTYGLHLAGATALVSNLDASAPAAGQPGNALAGIFVDTAVAHVMTIQYSSAQFNAGPGVLVTGAPLAGNITELSLDHLIVNGNAGYGVRLNPSTASVGVAITNSAIHDNASTGVYIESGNGSTTTESFIGDNIYLNGLSAPAKPTYGGIDFHNASTLTSFLANKVHDNASTQVGVEASAPGPGGGYLLENSSAACDANSNYFYCYAAGSLGLKVTDGTVHARRNYWKNGGAPTLDFTAVPPGTVDGSNPCAGWTQPTCGKP